MKPFGIQWYAYLGDAFDFAAKQYGVKTMQAVSEYNQNKELAAIEDFIIKEPDAIALGSVSADSSQLAAQKCNEAKIPLFIENSSFAPGPGKIVADLEFDWKGLGTVMAAKVTAKNWPKSKVFVVTGVIGTGPIDMFLEAFQAEAKARSLTIVGIQNGEYQQEKAYKITQDLIQSGKDVRRDLGQLRRHGPGHHPGGQGGGVAREEGHPDHQRLPALPGQPGEGRAERHDQLLAGVPRPAACSFPCTST